MLNSSEMVSCDGAPSAEVEIAAGMAQFAFLKTVITKWTAQLSFGMAASGAARAKGMSMERNSCGSIFAVDRGSWPRATAIFCRMLCVRNAGQIEQLTETCRTGPSAERYIPIADLVTGGAGVAIGLPICGMVTFEGPAAYIYRCCYEAVLY